MSYSTSPLDTIPMLEADTGNELDSLLLRLASSEIPGFCVRHVSLENVISGDNNSYDVIVNEINDKLQRTLGRPLNIVLRDYRLEPSNQSARGLHSDNPASESTRHFRIHRTVEGSCDIQFAREVVGAPSVFPERDDPYINSLLGQGLAATDYFEPVLHSVDNVCSGDFVVFTSVGPRPTWHNFITREAPRLSLVTFIETEQ